MYNPGGAFLPPSQETRGGVPKRTQRQWVWNFRYSRSPTCRSNDSQTIYIERKDERVHELACQLQRRSFRWVMCRDLISVSWDGKLSTAISINSFDMPCGDEEDDIRFRIVR